MGSGWFGAVGRVKGHQQNAIAVELFRDARGGQNCIRVGTFAFNYLFGLKGIFAGSRLPWKFLQPSTIIARYFVQLWISDIFFSSSSVVFFYCSWNDCFLLTREWQVFFLVCDWAKNRFHLRNDPCRYTIENSSVSCGSDNGRFVSFRDCR